MADALWTVAAFTLQIAALVLIALAVTELLRIRVPRHALRFWQVVMMIVLILPLAQPRGVSRPELPLLSEAISPAPVTAGGGGTTPVSAVPDAATVILAIILAGIVLRLLWLGLGLIRLRSIVAQAMPHPSLDAVSGELMQALGVSAAVKISDDLEGPATVGFRHPLVLMPRSVLSMSMAVQRAVLCHELLHVKRGDWLQTIGEEVWRSILWFHPLARVIVSRLSLSREMVVDETTISITRDRRAYAEALLAFSNPQPHVIGVTPFIGRRTLSRRISLIAEETPMPHRRALAHAGLAVLACLAITAVAVDRFPMFATLQAQSQVYTPGNGVSLPRVLHEVKPDYTREAMDQMIQGTVLLQCVVTEQGDVTDVVITKSLDMEYGLDQAAIDALKQWKFQPGRKDDKPVAVRITVESAFTLK